MTTPIQHGHHFAKDNTRLPTPGISKSFWHGTLHDLADHRTTPELPEECDVLIIGSGYAGASVAYNLAKSSSRQSIVILEARQTCSGATGRNGGHLRPDLYGHIPTYIERYGVDAGAEWAEYEIAHVGAIKKLVAEEEIDCDFTLTRTTDTWADEEGRSSAACFRCCC
jgi:glycine/D-amino acid oxidase-like deaminating enzyme